MSPEMARVGGKEEDGEEDGKHGAEERRPNTATASGWGL